MSPTDRPYMLRVRMTADEQAKLEGLAETAKLTVSDVVRLLIQSAPPVLRIQLTIEPESTTKRAEHEREALRFAESRMPTAEYRKASARNAELAAARRQAAKQKKHKAKRK